jgi:hypothetical protein
MSPEPPANFNIERDIPRIGDNPCESTLRPSPRRTERKKESLEGHNDPKESETHLTPPSVPPRFCQTP